MQPLLYGARLTILYYLCYNVLFESSIKKAWTGLPLALAFHNLGKHIYNRLVSTVQIAAIRIRCTHPPKKSDVGVLYSVDNLLIVSGEPDRHFFYAASSVPARVFLSHVKGTHKKEEA